MTKDLLQLPVVIFDPVQDGRTRRCPESVLPPPDSSSPPSWTTKLLVLPVHPQRTNTETLRYGLVLERGQGECSPLTLGPSFLPGRIL